MKAALLLFYVSLLFPFEATAQTYPAFKLDADKPEAGREIHFVYTGAFSKKIDPRITLYYNVNGDIRSLTLSAKFNGVATIGSFTVPDSTLSFNIKARNWRDTTEAFLFFVYKNAVEQKGSGIASVRFTNNNTYGVRDIEKVRQLYLDDFSKYPDLKPKHLIDYYQNTDLPIDPSQTIGAELNKIWTDSLADGKDEFFLAGFMSLIMRHNHLDQQVLISQIIEKYPTGISAFQKESMSFIINKIPVGDYLTDLTAMEIKYPKLVAMGRLDRLYWQIGQRLLQEGDIKGAESYVANMRSKHNQQDWYSSAAYQLLAQDRELPKAEEYIQKAIDMVAYCSSVRYISNPKEWAKKLLIEKGTYLDVYAQIESKMGKPAEASRQAAAAVQNNGFSDIREHYLRYLLDAGETRTALDTASKYIVKDQMSKNMISLLKEAYIKDKGSEAGYEAYYQELTRKADDECVFPAESKLNVPSIDFTLKDIENKPVTLSAYKGKPVVLYFLSTDYNDGQSNAFNDIFNSIIQKHKSSKITFLAIDGTFVSETDEASGRPLRIQKLKNFLVQKHLDYKVLMDDFHRDAKQTKNSFYRVNDMYSTNAVCQFYIIDKYGMVRYKSLPHYLLPASRFTKELNMALKLVE